jgi:single-strand selective monofunctional uracil DNA glycosylase
MSKKKIIDLSLELSNEVSQLKFSKPVTHVYNPLEYAWNSHKKFLNLYSKPSKKVIFLGMNPGPWGMAQTGVPFGEVQLIKNWMKVYAKIHKPHKENPNRPITGFSCERSEVSGQRLWEFFSSKFKDPKDFFKDHFVLNYCPLVFMEESGRNRTPDKLPIKEAKPLFEICDHFLKEFITCFNPELLIGVGGFAQKRLKKVFPDTNCKIETLLHPSPASPAANRGWAKQAQEQLSNMGLKY